MEGRDPRERLGLSDRVGHGQSFITALDKKTGRDIWKVNRDEETSWATPLIVEHDGRLQVITSATSRVRSYDFQNGRLLWEGDGVTENAIPTPVADDERVYLTSGYRGSRLMVVRLSAATGDIDRAGAIAWEVDRDTPYVPSPLLHQGVLYVLKSNSGVLTAYDAQSGRKLYGPQRVPGARNVYASPVAAGDRMYVTSREGTTVVLRPGPTFEVLATNVLKDEIDASPAVVDGEIFLRGSRYLYCIAVD